MLELKDDANDQVLTMLADDTSSVVLLCIHPGSRRRPALMEIQQSTICMLSVSPITVYLASVLIACGVVHAAVGSILLLEKRDDQQWRQPWPTA